MTKGEVIKLLVLIESIYPHFITKDETVQQWFQFCLEMDYEKVLLKLKTHIRKSPYPPAIADIAVLGSGENEFLKDLQNWKKEGQERIEHDFCNNHPKPLPGWVLEYSWRKSVNSENMLLGAVFYHLN